MKFARSRFARSTALAATSLLALAACSSDGDAADASAPAEAAAPEVSADLERDARYWQQLTSLLEPVEMPTMTDHRAYMLPTGGIVALHFDNMDLDAAENLNWLAVGVPATFCLDEQERVEEQFGEGFTHFHDMVNDVHGGEPGAEGVWFIHTAVRDFDAPWGATEHGIDHAFMPTPAPEC